MPVPRYGTRWMIIGLLLIAALAGSYYWYMQNEPYTHGGSEVGLIYGFIALGLMLFLLYFGIRKRSYRSRFGQLQEWLQAHIWMGILAFLVTLAHTGFRFEDKMATALFIVVSAVVASGIYGAILYKTVPRMLTDVESNLTETEMSEQLNQLSRSMARTASGKSSPFQRIYQGLQREAIPGPMAGWRLLLASPRGGSVKDSGREWTAMLGLVAKDEQEDLRQLLVTSRQQKELHLRLRQQQRYRNLLDFWLWIHLPLSIAMIVLIIAHLISVFYYAKIEF